MRIKKWLKNIAAVTCRFAVAINNLKKISYPLLIAEIGLDGILRFAKK